MKNDAWSTVNAIRYKNVVIEQRGRSVDGDAQIKWLSYISLFYLLYYLTICGYFFIKIYCTIQLRFISMYKKKVRIFLYYGNV